MTTWPARAYRRPRQATNQAAAGSERGYRGFFIGGAMFKASIRIEGRELVHTLHQPMRELILRTVAELRKCEPMPDREGLGRWGLSIPFEDWIRLREKYPELASTDAHTKSRAYLRFMRSDEAAPYRVRVRV